MFFNFNTFITIICSVFAFSSAGFDATDSSIPSQEPWSNVSTESSNDQDARSNKNTGDILKLYPAYYPLEFLTASCSPSLYKIRLKMTSYPSKPAYDAYIKMISEAKYFLNNDFGASDSSILILDEEGNPRDISYLDEVKIIFSGEDHLDSDGIMKSLQILKKYIFGEDKKNTAILMEGIKASQRPANEYVSGQILRSMTGQLWRDLQRSYNPEDFFIYNRFFQSVLSRQYFEDFGFSCSLTKPNKFNFIPEPKYDINGWEPDADISFAPNQLTLRNQSLGQSIEKKLNSPFNKVLVSAGLHHLPIFAYLIFQRLLEEQKEINEILLSFDKESNIDFGSALDTALGTDSKSLDSLDKFISHLLRSNQIHDSSHPFYFVAGQEAILSAIKGKKVAYIMKIYPRHRHPIIRKILAKSLVRD